ncbi:MAG TPA: hypothetical protein VGK19_00095 [Capsulimonadaceae bacterium]
MPHQTTPSAELNFRLIIVMVFFVALAFSARRHWLNVKELIAGGVVLVVSAGVMLFDITIRVAQAEYGQNGKALGMALVAILPFLLALCLAIYFLAKRLKSEPAPVQKVKPTKASRKARPAAAVAKTSSSTSDTQLKPKPARTQGRKRRF